VVFLVSLIHNIFPNGLADRGIEQFFFDRCMTLEFRERLLYDLLFCGPPLGFFKLVKQVLYRIVILLQQRESRVRC
jgi:hypothetical protein